MIELLCVGIFFFFLYRLLKNLGKSFPLFELTAFLYLLQYAIAPILEYKFGDKLNDIDINEIWMVFDVYQEDNLDTIDKLKRDKVYETRRISGALKQTINAHGPITMFGAATYASPISKP